MDEINKYIDDIFKNITKTKKSRRLKEQIKMAAKEKYNDLISEGISQDEAAKNVILQIGSLEDLKAEHPVKHRKLDIIAYILILPTMISLGYSIFVLLKMDTLKQLVMYEPIFLSFYILKPFNYFSLTFIILWFFNNSSLSVNKIKKEKNGYGLLFY